MSVYLSDMVGNVLHNSRVPDPAELVSSVEVDTVVSYRMVGLYDSESDEDVPLPGTSGHSWLSVGTSRLLMVTPDDVAGALFRFELWDGHPPPLDQTAWPLAEVVELFLPSGRIGVYEPMGYIADVFEVNASGLYHVRLAWRAGDRDPKLRWKASALAQFWLDTAPRSASRTS